MSRMEIAKYHYIYTLIDPRTNQVHYVGQSKHPAKRLEQHLNDTETSSTPVHEWLHELIHSGLFPTMVVVETIKMISDTDNRLLGYEYDIYERELAWMHGLRALGHPLLNQEVENVEDVHDFSTTPLPRKKTSIPASDVIDIIPASGDPVDF